MDNKYTFQNIYLYLKKNLKFYTLSFFLSLAILCGLFLYSSTTEKRQTEIENNAANKTVFSFILENEQGNLMNNSGALAQVFTTELSKTSFFSKDTESNFNVLYDDKSNSFKVFFDNSVKNSVVSETRNYLTSAIEQNKIDFFASKKIYFINENISSEDQPTGFSKKMLILAIGVIFVLTLLLGTLLASYFEKKKKIISQKFYLANSEMIIDINSLKAKTKENKISIINSIIRGNKKNKLIILAGDSEFKGLLSFNETKNFVISDLGDLKAELPIQPEEIVIICEQNKTEKVWYNRQIELAKNSVNTVKVIFI